jgi:hypothetical protein
VRCLFVGGPEHGKEHEVDFLAPAFLQIVEPVNRKVTSFVDTIAKLEPMGTVHVYVRSVVIHGNLTKTTFYIWEGDKNTR